MADPASAAVSLLLLILGLGPAPTVRWMPRPDPAPPGLVDSSRDTLAPVSPPLAPGEDTTLPGA